VGPSPRPKDNWGNSKESNDEGGAEKGGSGTRETTAGTGVVATGTLDRMARVVVMTRFRAEVAAKAGGKTSG
jgi:hypothetical protein